MKIIMDVWTGEYSQEHTARFIRTLEDALELTKAELSAGNLVNLRQDAAWGEYEDFDNRQVGRMQ